MATLCTSPPTRVLTGSRSAATCASSVLSRPAVSSVYTPNPARPTSTSPTSTSHGRRGGLGRVSLAGAGAWRGEGVVALGAVGALRSARLSRFFDLHDSDLHSNLGVHVDLYGRLGWAGFEKHEQR